MFLLFFVLLISTLVFFLADLAQIAIALSSIFDVIARNIWRMFEVFNTFMQMAYFCCRNPGFAFGLVWAFVSRVFSSNTTGKSNRNKKTNLRFKEKAQLKVKTNEPENSRRIHSINLLDEHGRIVITDQDFEPTMNLSEILSALNEQKGIFSEDFALLVTYKYDSKSYLKALSKECLEMTFDELILDQSNTHLLSASIETLLMQEIESIPLPYNTVLQVDFLDSQEKLILNPNLPQGAEDYVRSFLGPTNMLSSSQSPRLVQSGMALSFALRHWTRRDKDREAIIEKVEKVKVIGTLIDQEVSLK